MIGVGCSVYCSGEISIGCCEVLLHRNGVSFNYYGSVKCSYSSGRRNETSVHLVRDHFTAVRHQFTTVKHHFTAV